MCEWIWEMGWKDQGARKKDPYLFIYLSAIR